MVYREVYYKASMGQQQKLAAQLAGAMLTLRAQLLATSGCWTTMDLVA